jgi:hypothetical protein
VIAARLALKVKTDRASTEPQGWEGETAERNSQSEYVTASDESLAAGVDLSTSDSLAVTSMTLAYIPHPEEKAENQEANHESETKGPVGFHWGARFWLASYEDLEKVFLKRSSAIWTFCCRSRNLVGAFITRFEGHIWILLTCF